MSDTPGGPGSGDPDEPQNPFKGTPFEHLFGGGGGAPFGSGGSGMPDLSQLFGQIQAMMQPYDGPVNWDIALDLARKTVSSEGDPVPTQRQKDAVADVVHLADRWLEETTSFVSGVRTATAWSKTDWLLETLPVWKTLVEPVAESSTSGISQQLPEEMQGMAGQMMGFIGNAMGTMYANQAGSGLGALAGDVLSGSDIGVPLTEPGRAALLPANITAFADGLDVSEDDVMLFLSLREAAHQRLFAGVPWLRDHVIGAVREYAQGVQVNIEAIQQRVEEQMRGVDLNNPESLQNILEGGMFELPQSPEQKAALEKIEIVLALVEGWVDEVVSMATAEKMPAATKLQEQIRRRRAAGGPAEQTFSTLVGLQLRPRRLRDASALWGSLRARQGIEARDGVWMSPALLPTAKDLDDPLGFREGADAPESLSDEDFDAGLRQLLNGPDDSGPDDSGSGDSDSGA